MAIDQKLLEYATERQKECLRLVDEHGSIRAAARAAGVNESTLRTPLTALKAKAAMHGYHPDSDMTRPVPAPYVVKGTSTLYNKEGTISAQWVKTKLDETKAREAVEEWVRWLVEDARGISPVCASPVVSHLNSSLLTVYPMGDPHFGMHSWREETGDDFDLKIAERLTYAAIDRLVNSAPASETALILELGDFFHADNNTAATPRSGNALDVDNRWAKVMQVGLRAMVYVIQRTLEKHQNVIVRIVAGNHDPHSSYALALGLDAYFHNERRVQVELSPAVFWYYRFGKVLIGTTHGDTCKTDKLPAIMAADRSQDWGGTQFRYWYHGHIHHDSVKEFPGCMVESFRTLASKDAWHTSAGYRSGRDMKCLVLHKEYGEIERHRVGIEMLEAGNVENV